MTSQRIDFNRYLTQMGHRGVSGTMVVQAVSGPVYPLPQHGRIERVHLPGHPVAVGCSGTR
jgi:hypothetical protein